MKAKKGKGFLLAAIYCSPSAHATDHIKIGFMVCLWSRISSKMAKKRIVWEDQEIDNWKSFCAAIISQQTPLLSSLNGPGNT